MDEEFMDIPISNVEITFRVSTVDGQQIYSSGITYSRPLPLKVYGIWALRQGIPVGILNLTQEAQPPFAECFQVLIATDERAMWGRKCPHCGGYWRTGSPGLVQTAVCCYCGGHSEAHECLSDAQRVYVEACCAIFRRVLDEKKDGQFSIAARKLLEGVEEQASTALRLSSLSKNQGGQSLAAWRVETTTTSLAATDTAQPAGREMTFACLRLILTRSAQH